MIQKSYQDLVVRCAKDGHHPGLATVSSSAGMVWGNILFGGLIGLAVDGSQGAGYDYPSLITVEMGTSSVIQDRPVPVDSDTSGVPPAVIPASAPPSAAVAVPSGPDPRDRMNRQVEPQNPAPSKLGRFTVEVEQLAKAEQCSTSPTVALVAAGAGFENYSVACSNGDVLSVRCEFGNCRTLK